MKLQLAIIAFLFLPVGNGLAQEGNVYKITSADGESSYEAVFYPKGSGGSDQNFLYTAFDPDSKKFVYWVGKGSPKAVGRIWNSATGETTWLYEFPGAKQPLPVIESIDDIKAFPGTKNKDFKVEHVGTKDIGTLIKK
jgi:hypothetical protein